MIRFYDRLVVSTSASWRGASTNSSSPVSVSAGQLLNPNP
jgi:hypothetical protein